MQELCASALYGLKYKEKKMSGKGNGHITSLHLFSGYNPIYPIICPNYNKYDVLKDNLFSNDCNFLMIYFLNQAVPLHKVQYK